MQQQPNEIRGIGGVGGGVDDSSSASISSLSSEEAGGYVGGRHQVAAVSRIKETPVVADAQHQSQGGDAIPPSERSHHRDAINSNRDGSPAEAPNFHNGNGDGTLLLLQHATAASSQQQQQSSPSKKQPRQQRQHPPPPQFSSRSPSSPSAAAAIASEQYTLDMRNFRKLEDAIIQVKLFLENVRNKILDENDTSNQNHDNNCSGGNLTNDLHHNGGGRGEETSEGRGGDLNQEITEFYCTIITGGSNNGGGDNNHSNSDNRSASNNNQQGTILRTVLQKIFKNREINYIDHGIHHDCFYVDVLSGWDAHEAIADRNERKKILQHQQVTRNEQVLQSQPLMNELVLQSQPILTAQELGQENLQKLNQRVVVAAAAAAERTGVVTNSTSSSGSSSSSVGVGSSGRIRLKRRKSRRKMRGRAKSGSSFEEEEEEGGGGSRVSGAYPQQQQQQQQFLLQQQQQQQQQRYYPDVRQHPHRQQNGLAIEPAAAASAPNNSSSDSNRISSSPLLTQDQGARMSYNSAFAMGRDLDDVMPFSELPLSSMGRGDSLGGGDGIGRALLRAELTVRSERSDSIVSANSTTEHHLLSPQQLVYQNPSRQPSILRLPQQQQLHHHHYQQQQLHHHPYQSASMHRNIVASPSASPMSRQYHSDNHIDNINNEIFGDEMVDIRRAIEETQTAHVAHTRGQVDDDIRFRRALEIASIQSRQRNEDDYVSEYESQLERAIADSQRVSHRAYEERGGGGGQTDGEDDLVRMIAAQSIRDEENRQRSANQKYQVEMEMALMQSEHLEEEKKRQQLSEEDLLQKVLEQTRREYDESQLEEKEMMQRAIRESIDSLEMGKSGDDDDEMLEEVLKMSLEEKQQQASSVEEEAEQLRQALEWSMYDFKCEEYDRRRQSR